MGSPLQLQQCLACLAWLNWRICEMGGKWLYSYSFVGCCFQNLFIKVQVVQSYNSTDMATTWKNFHFILTESSDFNIVNNLSIATLALPMCMMTSCSVDEILLPGYMNWSTYFRDLMRIWLPPN